MAHRGRLPAASRPQRFKIAFINEIADLAEKVGTNVQEVARGIGLDNRIGRKFLHAGPGFGRACYQKDAMALTPIFCIARSSRCDPITF